MADNLQYFLGIEIGGTKIQLMVGDSQLVVIDQVNFPVGKVKEASIIKEKLAVQLVELTKKYHVSAIGVGFGGPVNSRTGQIYRSFHVDGWKHINLKKWIAESSQRPVFVDNDGNLAALAEAYFGAGKEYQRVFYMTLGSGVGGGFIIDGQIYHGKGPSEMEIGHIQLDKSGKTLESSCSGWAMNRKLGNLIKHEPIGILASLIADKQVDESKYLMQAIEAGDLEAKRIFIETIDDLAFGLSHIIHLLNPDVIIVGGGLSFIGETLTEGISEMLPKYLMSTLKSAMPKIKLSALKEQSVPLGALKLALTKYSNNQ